MSPSQSQFTPPLAGTPRPPLPLEHLNPHIKSCQSPFVLVGGARMDVERLRVQDPGLPGWATNRVAMTGVEAEDAAMCSQPFG